MKLKTIYLCQNCQYSSPKWLGKCPECSAWNSFYEDTINVGKEEKTKISNSPRKSHDLSPLNFTQLNEGMKQKISSGFNEFDRVLGEGFFSGSLTLLGGEPGIGKSTLTLQVAINIAKEKKVLLASGEESVNQVAKRAFRIGLPKEQKNLSVINEYNLESILEIVKSHRPEFLIIDSIQVISSDQINGTAGSIGQVRYCTEQIMETAKGLNIPTVLISHVTKDGGLAGPKVLEHLVDTVLLLEGDPFQHFRILKSSKNRFGKTGEVGIFEMEEEGLCEVKNPSEQFLQERQKNSIGSVVTATIEGSRPFLVEVQALVAQTTFGYAKRTANGFDLNRLQLLIAVLEKFGGLKLAEKDVFINVVGGIKLSEPACDLAILGALASSYTKEPIKENSLVFGEVGLSGELRKVTQGQKRSEEAKKMGLKNIMSPDEFKNIKEFLNNAFGGL